MKIKLKSGVKVPIPSVPFSNIEFGAEIEYEFDNKLSEDENLAIAKRLLESSVLQSKSSTSDLMRQLIKKKLGVSDEALEFADRLTPDGENDRHSNRN